MPEFTSTGAETAYLDLPRHGIEKHFSKLRAVDIEHNGDLADLCWCRLLIVDDELTSLTALADIDMARTSVDLVAIAVVISSHMGMDHITGRVRERLYYGSTAPYNNIYLI